MFCQNNNFLIVVERPRCGLNWSGISMRRRLLSHFGGSSPWDKWTRVRSVHVMGLWMAAWCRGRWNRVREMHQIAGHRFNTSWRCGLTPNGRCAISPREPQFCGAACYSTGRMERREVHHHFGIDYDHRILKLKQIKVRPIMERPSENVKLKSLGNCYVPFAGANGKRRGKKPQARFECYR